MMSCKQEEVQPKSCGQGSVMQSKAVSAETFLL